MAGTKKNLQRRWQTPEGQEKAEKVMGLLPKGRIDSIRDFVGEYEGKIDLRGLKVISYPTRSFDVPLETGMWRVAARGYEMRDMVLEELAFDYAEFHDMLISSCTFKDVSFEGVRIQNVRNFANRFERCSFANSVFRESSLGAGYGGDVTEYHDCDFSGTKMKGCSATFPLFEKCRFERVYLDDVDFKGSRFVECSFSGFLQGVTFQGIYVPQIPTDWHPPKALRNPMKDIDFSKSRANGLRFATDINLRDVALPTPQGHLFIWHPRKTYSCAIEAAKVKRPLRTREGQMMLINYLRMILENELRGPEALLEIADRELRTMGWDDLDRKTFIEIIEKCSAIAASDATLKP